MNALDETPAQLTLQEWDEHYEALCAAGVPQPWYGGPLRRHESAGDHRLCDLRFDNSPAALRLWNFLLSETSRLYRAKAEGQTIVATMKDLGTVPVMAYALPGTVAFYPDGTWWVPCIMRLSTGDLALADSLGMDETYCPVRAMLGAFATYQHFPRPDLRICSCGAICDDFAAVAQRLESLGHEIVWWEIPPRRRPGPGEEAAELPGGNVAPRIQVTRVRAELERIALALQKATGERLTEERLESSIRESNRVRAALRELRRMTFTAPRCPLPGLELLIAEMLAVHYCSNREETLHVLQQLLSEVRRRVSAGEGFFAHDAVRVYWINPVADLRAMNLLEACGGRLCGTEFMFCHAIDEIPAGMPPMEALARTALADPMVGPAADRAARVVREASELGAEAVVISRIPGASHCGMEGTVIRDIVRRELGIPVLEIEVPPVSDALGASLRTRLEALVETVRLRRTS